jgi:8-oxo-dGTP pyrophosphatase MutT (NUDIX family)
MDDRTLYKVTAYVTRGAGDARDLLVFRHPTTGGVQLPAGTVESGEDPAVAVLREVAEETGLTETTLVRELAVEETVLPVNYRPVLRTSPILLEPHPEAERHEVHIRNGFWTEIGEQHGPYRRITHRMHEYEPGRTWTGWVPEDVLGTRQVRHHYEVRPSGPTPDRWTHFAEDAWDFVLYWVSISEDPGLEGAQTDWRRLVLDKLLDAS